MTQREQFEAAYRARYPFASSQPNKFELDLDEYTDTTVNVAWFMWMAARVAALEEAAKICDVTPVQPFRPSIEAAWAIRKLIGCEK